MTRPVLVLRPEPGNAVTVARLRARDLTAIALPLFMVVPVGWTVPDSGDHDALLLTSANAIRHGGAGLDRLISLPVIAVGAETARVAQGAGFTVVATGTKDSQALLPEIHAYERILHLAGRDHRAPETVRSVTVYASNPVAVTTLPAANAVVMLHSPRAARRFAELISVWAIDRTAVRLAVMSPAVGDAAGEGWASVTIAAKPTDIALVASAAKLAGGD